MIWEKIPLWFHHKPKLKMRNCWKRFVGLVRMKDKNDVFMEKAVCGYLKVAKHGNNCFHVLNGREHN